MEHKKVIKSDQIFLSFGENHCLVDLRFNRVKIAENHKDKTLKAVKEKKGCYIHENKKVNCDKLFTIINTIINKERKGKNVKPGFLLVEKRIPNMKREKSRTNSAVLDWNWRY